MECYFSEKNEQCIKEKCPFHKGKKKKVAFSGFTVKKCTELLLVSNLYISIINTINF